MTERYIMSNLDCLLERIERDCPFNMSWADGVKVYMASFDDYVRSREVAILELADFLAYEKVRSFYKIK